MNFKVIEQAFGEPVMETDSVDEAVAKAKEIGARARVVATVGEKTLTFTHNASADEPWQGLFLFANQDVPAGEAEEESEPAPAPEPEPEPAPEYEETPVEEPEEGQELFEPEEPTPAA